MNMVIMLIVTSMNIRKTDGTRSSDGLGYNNMYYH